MQGDENDGLEISSFDPESLPRPTHRQHISAREYYRYMLAIRNTETTSYHWLWSKRKLAELFVVTVLNRIESYEMELAKKRQKDLRYALPVEFIQALQKGLKVNLVVLIVQITIFVLARRDFGKGVLVARHLAWIAPSHAEVVRRCDGDYSKVR